MNTLRNYSYLNLLSVLFILFTNGFAYGGEVIDPKNDITYLGAFKLPESSSGSQYGWAFGTQAMTYYPKGDPSGDSDGTPGSLFATNHVYEQYLAEINIPVPVKSKNLSDLKTATMLQNFKNINNGVYSTSYMETEICYLPKQGSQSSDKIYIQWNDWYNPGDYDLDRNAWCDLTLSNSNTKGPWNLGNAGQVAPHSVGEYMFEIPSTWAELNTPNKLIITGKYREGGSGDGGYRFGGGPAMYAFGPWGNGNPPASETNLSVITLLNYIGGHIWTCTANGDTAKVMDRWEGGAWVTAGSKSAIILTGRKGFGENYYGENPNCSSGDKGYHNLGGYRPYMLFYNPDDLAAVAAGKKAPYEPQPYATLDCSSFAFNPFTYCVNGFSSAAYDRINNLLYVAEPKVDNYKAVIHVFKINVSEKTCTTANTPSGLSISK